MTLAIAGLDLMPAVIQRSADHFYTYEGKRYRGVTGILKVIDKSDALMSWAARNTAEAALAMAEKRMYEPRDDQPSPPSALQHLLDTVGPQGVVKALTARSSWKRDEAAALGTEIHALADMVVNGVPTPSMEPITRERVLKYAEWWTAAGWTLRTSEAMVIHPAEDTSMGYGGTIDLLARDRDGNTVLADIKTGKAVYKEAVLQLTAYGEAPFIQPGGGKIAYEMPAIDRYVVLHVTAEGVREVEIPVGTLERVAWWAAVELSLWADTLKGKRL